MLRIVPKNIEDKIYLTTCSKQFINAILLAPIWDNAYINNTSA